MALKLEITQLKESQDFLGNNYDELKTEFEQLNVINRKQETDPDSHSNLGQIRHVVVFRWFNLDQISPFLGRLW